jgi:hypothetical protein
MAFGDSMKAVSSSNGSGEGKTFINQWIDPQRGANRTGRRVFRILPVDGNMPDETRWAEFWVPVMQGGNQRQQRVMVDASNPFNNPVWKRLYADLPKEVNGKPNQARKLPKQRFALNVLDMTKVITLPDGTFAYPSEDNKYYMLKDGNTVKVDGVPTVLNQVRILEGSSGKAGGKHMLQQLADLVGSVSHPDNDDQILQLTEFDIALKVTGDGMDTRRSFMIAGNYKALTDEQLAMPRFDIAAWAKPWPDDVIDALLDGEDFTEVMENSGIVQFPALIGDDEEVPF